jgi:hypothetical protein
MADLAITAANVVPGVNAKVVGGTAGAAITAGKTVYQDPTDLRFKLADCDSAVAAERAVNGIALNGASAGQPVDVLIEGDITIGAVLTAGTVYFLSGTAGGICPVADLNAGDYPTIIGIAKSASVLSVKINGSGVAI